MRKSSKIVVAGAFLLALGVAAVASAAEERPSEPKTRKPWTKPLELVDDEKLAQLRTAICTAWRAEVPESELLEHVLAQVWPSVPWPSVLTISVDGDHESVDLVIKGAWAEIENFRALRDDGARTEWCESGGPIPKSTYEQRKTVYDQRFSEQPGMGKLSLIKGTGWKGGISQYAGRILAAFGLNTKELRTEYMRAISASPWNRRIYARNARESDPSYAVADGMIVSPAWLPRHIDATESILTVGRIPPKNIYNDGEKIGPGASYGLVFGPVFDVNTARDNGIIVITEDQPNDLIALLED